MKRIICFLITMSVSEFCFSSDADFDRLNEALKTTTPSELGCESCNLINAPLAGLNLGINLKKAKFGNNDFKYTNFGDANIEGVDFRTFGSRVVDLSQALIYFAKNLDQARCNAKTKLPIGILCEKSQTARPVSSAPEDAIYTLVIDPEIQHLLQDIEKTYSEFARNQKVIAQLKQHEGKTKLVNKLQYEVLTEAISRLKETNWNKYSPEDVQALKNILKNMVHKSYWILRAFVLGEQKEYLTVEKLIDNVRAITERIFKDVALLYQLSAKQYDVTSNISKEAAHKLRALAHDILTNKAPVVHDIGKPGNVRRAMWFFMLKPEWNYPENHYRQDRESLLNREEMARDLLKDLSVQHRQDQDLSAQLPDDFGA